MGSFYYAKGDRKSAKTLELTQVDDLNSAQWLVIPGSNPELIPLVITDFNHTSQGVTAASDYLFHLRFSNELTTVGCHVKSGLTADDFEDNAGMLHVNYVGKVATPDPEMAHMGWMGLDLLNEVYVPKRLVDQRTEEEELQNKQPTNTLAAYKHSYIDAIIRGKTLVIEIGHYNRNDEGNLYIAKFVDQWTNPDKVAALADRNDAIQGRSDEINIIYPLKREAKKAAASNGNGTNGASVDAATGEVAPTAPQELLIAVVGRKTRKNLFDVPAGDYPIAQGGKLVGSKPIPWDPTDGESVFVWQGIAEALMEVDLS